MVDDLTIDRGSRQAACKIGTRSAGYISVENSGEVIRGVKRVGEPLTTVAYPRGSYATFVALVYEER